MVKDISCGRKSLAIMDRKVLIDGLISEMADVNVIDLLSILSAESFSFPEDMFERNFTQAHLEYIAGLASSLPYKKDAEIPSRDRIEAIKKTALEVLQSYFLEYLPPSLEAVTSMTDREIQEKECSLRMLMYYLFVRGEGYPDQLWKASVDQYAPHNDFLRTRFGFSIEEAVEVFRWLIKKIEEKANAHFRSSISIAKESMSKYKRWRTGDITNSELLSAIKEIRSSDLYARLEAHNKATKEIFLFRISELEDVFGSEVTRCFVNRFGARMGEINRNFLEPKDFNELNAKPILIVDDEFVFIPVPMLLFQAPLKTLHYDLIQDSTYHQKYEAQRGEYLEKNVCNCFGRIFGFPNLYSNLRYGPGEQDEVDLLIRFDTKLLIVECKSKSLTLPARQGSPTDIDNDFTKAVQAAYDQARRARGYILRNKEAEFRMRNGGKLVIGSESINEIFLVCLLSESFSFLATDLSGILKKDSSDPYPWAVCLRDLESASEYLQDPYLFMHFLRRRLPLHGKVLSPDELDYFGSYLVDGLYFQEAFKRGATVVFLVGYTEQFDKDYLRRIGRLKFAQVGTTWSNPAFENLLGSIKLIGAKGHSDIILTLLDMDSKSRDLLIKYIVDMVEKVRGDGRRHDFTLIFGKFGISFVAMTRRCGLQDRVLGEAVLKKYRYKPSVWLGLGRDVSDDHYLVNEFVYLEYDWKYDPKIEEAAGHLKGKRVSFRGEH